MPTIAVTMPLFWIKSICRWKIDGASLSKPTIKPPITCNPARWIVLTFCRRSRFLFWVFRHSARLASSGDSMPIKTESKPAATIISISSGSSARLIEASVKKTHPFLPLRHSIRAGSKYVLRYCLFPIKLSSTKNMLLRQPAA